VSTATAKPVKPPLALMSAHPAWCVFPIKRGRKYPPLFDDNLRLASSNPTQIWSWGVQNPGCNWGLACARSHLIVMDVDQKLGKHGRNTLERLELIHGQLPETFEVRSPSGGRHIYFHETNIVRHRMKLSAFGRDVDSTNYVLLPGSVLSGVGAYRTVVKAMVAPAPDWFAEYLDAPEIDDNSQVPAVELDTPENITRAVHYLCNDAKPSIQFQNGEFRLLMTAAMLKDIGISEDKAIELLNEHYNVPGKCEPLWDVGEGATADRLDVKVHNAWQYLLQTQPGSRTAAVAFGDDPVDAAALNAMVRWWKDRAAVVADGGPTPRELKLMRKKGLKS
jgi:hypothetical protein